MNVLLVDDEAPFIDTVTKRLVKRGIRVFTALSGDEALGLLAGDSGIEIVVLDIRMPGLSGHDTLAEIKRRFPSVEVIILTGHSTVESAIKTKRLGAFDYLGKPCDIEELITKIQEAFGRVRHREEADRDDASRKGGQDE